MPNPKIKTKTVSDKRYKRLEKKSKDNKKIVDLGSRMGIVKLKKKTQPGLKGVKKIFVPKTQPIVRLGYLQPLDKKTTKNGMRSRKKGGLDIIPPPPSPLEQR